MIKKLHQYKLTLLIITAIICGVIWRVEIEYHGWQGLIWLSYFHIAIPIGCILFLALANLYIECKWQKRLLLSFIAMIYGILIYCLLKVALTYFFTSGPSAFVLMATRPEWQNILLRYSAFFIIPFIPISIAFILRGFGYKTQTRFLIFSILSIISSVFISILIEGDFIHSIKSGTIIPLWVFSIGLVVIGLKKEPAIIT